MCLDLGWTSRKIKKTLTKINQNHGWFDVGMDVGLMCLEVSFVEASGPQERAALDAALTRPWTLARLLPFFGLFSDAFSKSIFDAKKCPKRVQKGAQNGAQMVQNRFRRRCGRS